MPTCRRQYPGRTDGLCPLVPFRQLRPSLDSLHHPFRGLHSVHSRYGLQTRQVAKATLCTGGFSSFVTSAPAPVATGWSEPVPGRDSHPLLTSAFSRRTKKVRARCDQNLFAALKSANNITTRHSRAYSAFVLEGQQDAGAIFADLSLHQRSDAHTAGAA